MASLNKLTCCSCAILKTQTSSTGVNLTFVRFRKPRWVPKAPSKKFKVREPTPIDPVEDVKLKEWTRLYNTERKSLRSYIQNHNQRMESREAIEKKQLPFKTVFNSIIDKNTAWNNKTAVIREAEMIQIAKDMKLREQKIAARDERERKEIHSDAMKKVKEVQEWKENYVTPENIDDVVEELLNSRADHEFALCTDGSTIGTAVDEDLQKENTRPAE